MEMGLINSSGNNHYNALENYKIENKYTQPSGTMIYADDTWDIDDSEISYYLVDKEYIYMSLDQGVVDLNGGFSTQKSPSQCLNRRCPVISCVI